MLTLSRGRLNRKMYEVHRKIYTIYTRPIGPDTDTCRHILRNTNGERGGERVTERQRGRRRRLEDTGEERGRGEAVACVSPQPHHGTVGG